MLSHAQRFDITFIGGNIPATPYSLGCPSMTHAVDRKAFEHSEEEKAQIWSFKKQLGKTKHHKFELQFKGAF